LWSVGGCSALQRDALKRLDYDSVNLQEVQILPSIFNSNIVFELPSIRDSIVQSQAKLMVGMDKRHNRHAWIKTVTLYVKNDMNLMFRISSCMGHVYYGNPDCKYLCCIHYILPVNKTERNGYTLIPFEVGCPALPGYTFM
jgi:hypothetical protein